MSALSSLKVAEVRFVVPGEPVGKARPRSQVVTDRNGNPLKSAKNGRFVVKHYSTDRTAEYEDRVKLMAERAMNGIPPLVGPLRLELEMRFRLPESWSQVKQRSALTDEIRPQKKPDASNVLKAIEDGMNGVTWGDDDQVAEVAIRRVYRVVPGVVVRVFVLDGTQQMELV